MNEMKRTAGKDFVDRYHAILCDDRPDFLEEYVNLPVLRRLDGIGLLCGTDWTPLFDNKFFYSRLDYSVGVALIMWRFTHDKRQTLAGLFHDVATPAFSHVIDFRNGDTEKQESTEEPTRDIINEDLSLSEQLFRDGIYKYEIDDYSKYPVANNSIPGLNADRIEYMYPSGAALDGTWTLDEISNNFSFTGILKNEQGLDEIGFMDTDAAIDYARKFLGISKLLQKNEDKLAMQLLADSVSKAVECGFLSESDLYELDEKSIVRCFDRIAESNKSANENPMFDFCRLWRTFRGMNKIIRSAVPMENSYNISLQVKKRYVDPLVKIGSKSVRISKISDELSREIDDFLKFNDSTYGSVPWI